MIVTTDVQTAFPNLSTGNGRYQEKLLKELDKLDLDRSHYFLLNFVIPLAPLFFAPENIQAGAVARYLCRMLNLPDPRIKILQPESKAPINSFRETIIQPVISLLASRSNMLADANVETWNTATKQMLDRI